MSREFEREPAAPRAARARSIHTQSRPPRLSPPPQRRAQRRELQRHPAACHGAWGEADVHMQRLRHTAALGAKMQQASCPDARRASGGRCCAIGDVYMYMRREKVHRLKLSFCELSRVGTILYPRMVEYQLREAACGCFQSSSDPAPVLRALVSPRGRRERLRWHAAVGRVWG